MGDRAGCAHLVHIHAARLRAPRVSPGAELHTWSGSQVKVVMWMPAWPRSRTKSWNCGDDLVAAGQRQVDLVRLAQGHVARHPQRQPVRLDAPPQPGQVLVAALVLAHPRIDALHAQLLGKEQLVLSWIGTDEHRQLDLRALRRTLWSHRHRVILLRHIREARMQSSRAWRHSEQTTGTPAIYRLRHAHTRSRQQLARRAQRQAHHIRIADVDLLHRPEIAVLDGIGRRLVHRVARRHIGGDLVVTSSGASGHASSPPRRSSARPRHR